MINGEYWLVKAAELYEYFDETKDIASAYRKGAVDICKEIYARMLINQSPYVQDFVNLADSLGVEFVSAKKNNQLTAGY